MVCDVSTHGPPRRIEASFSIAPYEVFKDWPKYHYETDLDLLSNDLGHGAGLFIARLAGQALKKFRIHVYLAS